MLSSIEIENIRSINKSGFSPKRKLVVFWGNNGSGKTSILESINILSCGKSFRSSKIDSVVTAGRENLRVCGVVERNNEKRVISVSRGEIGQSSRIGNVEISISELAKFFPVRVLSADSQTVIEGSPELRRSILDWGMFHVEPLYHGLWKEFRAILSQRNALVKNGALYSREGVVWEERFLDISEKLNEIRMRYSTQLSVALTKLYRDSGFGGEVSFRLLPGWKEDIGLEADLARNADFDFKFGYTRVGPHRYDIEVLLDGRDSKKHLSRGQQKIIAYALAVVQSQMFVNLGEQQPILLADEMLTELDAYNSEVMVKTLNSNFSQIFFTFNGESLPKFLQNYDFDLFHVEHGTIFQ